MKCTVDLLGPLEVVDRRMTLCLMLPLSSVDIIAAGAGMRHRHWGIQHPDGEGRVRCSSRRPRVERQHGPGDQRGRRAAPGQALGSCPGRRSQLIKCPGLARTGMDGSSRHPHQVDTHSAALLSASPCLLQPGQNIWPRMAASLLRHSRWTRSMSSPSSPLCGLLLSCCIQG